MHQVFVDRQRHTFLRYRDTGKTVHFVTMLGGSVDVIMVSSADSKKLKPAPANCTPQHFAEVCLNGTLDVSRSARSILRSILQGTEVREESPGAASFSGDTVALEEIARALGIDSSKARKHLRKLMDKPGTQWVWPAAEAEKIRVILSEIQPS